MGRKKTNKVLDLMAIAKSLMEKKQPDYEDGCVGVEVENYGHYLHCYDRFDGQSSEYTLCSVNNGVYTHLEISDDIMSYLKSELRKVYDENIEEEIEQEKEIFAEDLYWECGVSRGEF